MRELFASLQQTAESGELPTVNDVNSFLHLSEKMAMHADDSWHSEAEDFLHLTRQLLMVVKKQNFQETVLLIDALHDAQTFCHKSFRVES
ncbi:GAK system XXXCH domain-containing protein [Desulfonatronum parangueonense]